MIVIGGASNVTLNGVYFGASAESHIVGQNGANITVSASYTISGGAINHYWSSARFADLRRFGNYRYAVRNASVYDFHDDRNGRHLVRVPDIFRIGFGWHVSL